MPTYCKLLNFTRPEFAFGFLCLAYAQTQLSETDGEIGRALLLPLFLSSDAGQNPDPFFRIIIRQVSDLCVLEIHLHQGNLFQDLVVTHKSLSMLRCAANMQIPLQNYKHNCKHIQNKALIV
ncbi:hypothetical protein F2P81_007179 [Scophthalmus maximus]|uniref:Uncharacterized protein n=1 Tax=Scophthalmus maximus TaxID=52904 RepID=A0A6A4TEL3_SCOMX|nr:hypothetical protein F2P81_007179 [Scophthalmus maximus]